MLLVAERAPRNDLIPRLDTLKFKEDDMSSCGDFLNSQAADSTPRTAAPRHESLRHHGIDKEDLGDNWELTKFCVALHVLLLNVLMICGGEKEY